jgi:hypothetical protein
LPGTTPLIEEQPELPIDHRKPPRTQKPYRCDIIEPNRPSHKNN